MLFGVLARVAAIAEACMISIFGLVVWAPQVVATPGVRLPWTAFIVTWAIAAGCWAVAQNIPSKQPLVQHSRLREPAM
jgi:hypothetical protein